LEPGNGIGKEHPSHQEGELDLTLLSSDNTYSRSSGRTPKKQMSACVVFPATSRFPLNSFEVQITFKVFETKERPSLLKGPTKILQGISFGVPKGEILGWEGRRF